MSGFLSDYLAERLPELNPMKRLALELREKTKGALKEKPSEEVQKRTDRVQVNTPPQLQQDEGLAEIYRLQYESQIQAQRDAMRQRLNTQVPTYRTLYGRNPLP